MLEVKPSGNILGARIEGLDLSGPLSADDFALIVRSLAAYGVLCFPRQDLEPSALKAFGARFGRLEVNVAASPVSIPMRRPVTGSTPLFNVTSSTLVRLKYPVRM